MAQPTGTLEIGDYSYKLNEFDQLANGGARANVYSSHRTVWGMPEINDGYSLALKHKFDVTFQKNNVGTSYTYAVTWATDKNTSEPANYTSNTTPADWQDEYLEQTVFENGHPYESYDGITFEKTLNTNTIKTVAVGYDTNRNSEGASLCGTYVEQINQTALTINPIELTSQDGTNTFLCEPQQFVSAYHMMKLYAATYNKYCAESVSAYSVPALASAEPSVGA